MLGVSTPPGPHFPLDIIVSTHIVELRYKQIDVTQSQLVGGCDSIDIY